MVFNMKKILFLFLFSFYALITDAKAMNNFTGTELYSMCKNVNDPSQDTNSHTLNMQCAMYFNGLIDMYGIARLHIDREELIFCLPEQATVQQYINVFNQFYEENPQSWHLPSKALVFRSLHLAFPCS